MAATELTINTLDAAFAYMHAAQRASAQFGCVRCKKPIRWNQARSYGLDRKSRWKAAHYKCVPWLEKYRGILFTTSESPAKCLQLS